MRIGQFRQCAFVRVILFTAIVVVFGAVRGWGQELGGAGTIQGTVKDPTGAPMTAVSVEISNPVTGFKRSGTTDAAGRFVFRNLPPNGYHLSVTAQGFAPYQKDVDVRSAVPLELTVPLALAGTALMAGIFGLFALRVLRSRVASGSARS